MRANSRQRLIEEMRAHLERDSFLRVEILFVLCVAGSIAFLTSAFTLWAGLTSMAMRYALAVLSGYGGFLVMLRAWLEYRQGIWDERLAGSENMADFTPGPPDFFLDGGGDSPRFFFLDLDDLWWLVLLICALLGALITIGYVIYDAPQLLAEVALDAGLVSAMYHRIRQEPQPHWSRAALRRTWIPATILIFFMSIAGYAMEHLVPHARSIGDVLRAALRG
jgi:hypothetical protein